MNFFDLHCDTPYECYTKITEFKSNCLAVSGDKGSCFNIWYQTFAVWIKDDIENPFSLYKKIISDFKAKLREKPDNLNPIFALEGGAAIEKEERLFEIAQDNIKIITLTWNGENKIAGGCKSDKTLTIFGERIIKTMNKIKIACDLSHLNEKSFYKAIELTEFPLATHSNLKSVCNHIRNLSDYQVKLICEKGGIIGLCPYYEFLGGDVIDKIYENIYKLCEMGYENNIAFGSDFDGAIQDEILSDISKIPSFYHKLKQKGIDDNILNKLFYKNAYNFIANLN